MEEDMTQVAKKYRFDAANELTLPDFYRDHKDNLPMLVVVTGGHYGPTKWDEMSTDQVIRINHTHSVRRVLARDSDEARNHRLEYISIPVNTNYRYHVIASLSIKSAPMSMEEILSQRELPVLVQFSRNLPIPDAGKNKDGSISTLLIVKTHEEHFLMGNYLLLDKIGAETAAIALTPMITITAITALRGKPHREFQHFLQYLENFVAENCKFEEKNCDLRIKKYTIGDQEIKDTIKSDDIFPEGIYNDTGTRLPAPPLPVRKTSTKQTEEEHYMKIKDAPHTSHRTPADLPKEQPFVYSEPHDHEKSPNLSFMTVKQVCETLHSLKLGKYAKKFKSEMIDGEILKELDRKILVKDFNFSVIEAIRLEKFIQTGHIPS